MIRLSKLFILLTTALLMTSARTADDWHVSMVQLLANPEKYDGKVVRVEGYLHWKFEDCVLYLSKSDGDYLIGKNGVWISSRADPELQPLGDWFNKKKRQLVYFDERYVLVEGVFDMNEHGHMGANAGGITQVRRVLELKRYHR
jgi:hypothetical protein